MKKLNVGKKIYSSANRYRYPLRNKSLNTSINSKDNSELNENETTNVKLNYSIKSSNIEQESMSVKNKTCDDLGKFSQEINGLKVRRKSTALILKKNLFKSLDNTVLGSEIKDTVNCYICYQKLHNPKMCSFCHRMACESCLKMWFKEEKKKKCGYCKEVTSFDKMIPVPFMDTVADFIQSVLDQKKEIEKYENNVAGGELLGEENEEIKGINPASQTFSRNTSNLRGSRLDDLASCKASRIATLNDIEEQTLDEENDESSGDEYNSIFFGDGDTYCVRHKKERLFYFCLNCEKSYCRTCFVFFGEEKDKHIGHQIMEYKVYKKAKLNLLLKEKGKLKEKIEQIKKYIEKSVGYKLVYEYDKKMYNVQIENLKQKMNKLIDESISNIDNFISKLNNIIADLKGGEDKLKTYIADCLKINSENYSDYKSNLKFNNELYQKLIMMNSHIYISAKDLDKLIGSSKSVHFECLETKIGEFDHDNIFFNKNLKFGTSPFELIVDNKDKKAVGINVFLPKKVSLQNKHTLAGFVVLTKRGEVSKIFKLDENKENSILARKFNKWKYVAGSNYKKSNRNENFSLNSFSLDKENSSTLSNVNANTQGLNDSDLGDYYENYDNININRHYIENDNDCILTKKIEWDTFSESKFRIKGVIYDFYID